MTSRFCPSSRARWWTNLCVMNSTIKWWYCRVATTPPEKRPTSTWMAGTWPHFSAPPSKRKITADEHPGPQAGWLPRVGSLPVSMGAATTREYRKDGFVISTDRSRLDADAIHGFLTDLLLGEGNSPGDRGSLPREFPVFRSVLRGQASRVRTGDLRFRDLRLPRRCFRARTVSGTGTCEVADGMHRGASGVAGIAPLDAGDARRSRPVRAVRLYSAGAVRSMDGTS